jgi:ParB/RepB/Spo0J family partition protein
MTITDRVQRIAIADIRIDRENRQRRNIVTADLERSIAKNGLLQPIIIDQDLWLKAGERRLTACRNLGHQDILARFVEDLSPIEAQIIELEENIKRSDLEWPEIIRAVGTIHALYEQTEPGWTMTDTGEALGLAQPTISTYLRVFEVLDDPRVADSGSINEAANKIRRRDQRAAGDALEELLGTAEALLPSEFATNAAAAAIDQTAVVTAAAGVTLAPLAPQTKGPEPEVILNSSFLEWAPLYEGPKFNLIHCDFPYGIGVFAGPQGRQGEPGKLYDDSAETYWALLHCLLDNLDRVMSLSGHLMFWYSARLDGEAIDQTRRVFLQKAPSLKFYHYHLIWLKSDNSGIASDPRYTPRHVYETCLLARRSDRNLRMIKSDAYSAPTDKKLHVSTKPEPMLRFFMEMIVDETTSLLDPTCGSGAALRAADSLGAKRLLGLEIDSACCEVARTAFRNARHLRTAASHL